MLGNLVATEANDSEPLLLNPYPQSVESREFVRVIHCLFERHPVTASLARAVAIQRKSSCNSASNVSMSS